MRSLFVFVLVSLLLCVVVGHRPLSRDDLGALEMKLDAWQQEEPAVPQAVPVAAAPVAVAVPAAVTIAPAAAAPAVAVAAAPAAVAVAAPAAAAPVAPVAGAPVVAPAVPVAGLPVVAAPVPVAPVAAVVPGQVAPAAAAPVNPVVNVKVRPNRSGFSKQFAVGMPILWAIDDDGKVYTRVNGVHTDARWKKSKSQSRFSNVFQTTSSGENKIYALSRTGEVLRRMNITTATPFGQEWKKLVGKLHTMSISNRGGLWATNDMNHVYFKPPVAGSSWERIPDRDLSMVAAGQGVIGLTKEGALVARVGVTDTNHTGGEWRVIAAAPGDQPLSRVATGLSGQVWAVTQDGGVLYKASIDTPAWTVVPSPTPVSKLVIAGDGGVAAVTRAKTLLFRRGINATLPIGVTWTNSTKDGGEETIKFRSIGVGPSFEPLPGSQRRPPPPEKKAHVGRGLPRMFEVTFGQDYEEFRKTSHKLPLSFTSLIKLQAGQVQLLAITPTQSGKGSIGKFKLTRGTGPHAITPADALKKIKVALMDTKLLSEDGKELQTAKVDPSTLFLVKPNGKRIKVTATARKTPSRAERSRDPDEHKLTLSTIYYKSNKGFVLDQIRVIPGEIVSVVLSTRAGVNDTSAQRSQQWVMNMAGQVYFKDSEGDRQCLQAPAGKFLSGAPLKLIMCSESRNDRQLFQWSRESQRLVHILSGKCVTAANSLPKDQDPLSLVDCTKGGSRRQRFGFQSLVSAKDLAKAKAKSLIPVPSDYNITFRVDLEKNHQTLPKDFKEALVMDLKSVTKVAKRRIVVLNITAIQTSTPVYDSRVTIELIGAKDDSGDVTSVDALKILETQFKTNDTTLLKTDTWKNTILNTFKVLSTPPPPEPESNMTSKIEYFLAPGNVIEGGFGGKPGGELVIASYNTLSKSQAWLWSPKLGLIYWKEAVNENEEKRWCITAPETVAGTIKDGSKLTTKLCLNTTDEFFTTQQFSYDRSTQAFTHRASGKCIELLGRNTVGGTPITLATCGPQSNAQAWDFPASYPKDLKKQLVKEQKKEQRIEAIANKAVEDALKAEGKEKLLQAKAKAQQAKFLAAEKKAEEKKEQAKKEQIQFLALRKSLPKTTYVRHTTTTTYGNSKQFTCRDLSNYFGISHAETIGFHTPALYRTAWTTKKCSTKPLTCQELTDCYDFENMNDNNVWALKNGFKPNSTIDSFKYAPFLVATRYFGLFKHAPHAHGFHGADEHILPNGTNSEHTSNHSHDQHHAHGDHSHSREHGHTRKCTGYVPWNCQQLSDGYQMSIDNPGTAPKCVQAKFKYLGCTTLPEQTCQVLSDRFGLKSAFAETSTTSASPRFQAIAVAHASMLPDSVYVAPQEVVDLFVKKSCRTVPIPCQNVSDTYNTWPGHKGMASKDVYRQFLLRNCTTRPTMTCAQLSDSFLFGSPDRHPNPTAHGHTVESIGADIHRPHALASASALPTTFVEVASTYSADTLRSRPMRPIPAAYFEQWIALKCTTKPHSCQGLSDIYGISPSNRGAASKAIARTFSAVKRCATHPMLSCKELSTIMGITNESVDYTAEYLQRQWKVQNCTSSVGVTDCQYLSDAYDLPRGEWSSYAPKGVHAQFKALGCMSTPLPTCQALSDYWFINHAQIDPSRSSEDGIADRLILAKYSRWGCHHQFRDCQTISNFFLIGSDFAGNIVASANVPQYARDIYTHRKCQTAPIHGVVPGKEETPQV